MSALYAIAGALKVLVALPGVLFFPLALGALLLRRSRRAGWGVIAATAVVAYVIACPFFGALFLRALQTSPAIPSEIEREALRARADAICVLAATHSAEAPEYGGRSVGALTLERLRYGAELARRSGLPLLVSGGVPERGQPALAASMAAILSAEWGLEARWIEDGSADTRGNANLSAALLAPAGVRRVYVVTHAWHMPRALLAFQNAGLEPVAAPTAFRSPPRAGPLAFWPSARGLSESALAWHELVGLVYYRLRP